MEFPAPLRLLKPSQKTEGELCIYFPKTIEPYEGNPAFKNKGKSFKLVADILIITGEYSGEYHEGIWFFHNYLVEYAKKCKRENLGQFLCRRLRAALGWTHQEITEAIESVKNGDVNAKSPPDWVWDHPPYTPEDVELAQKIHAQWAGVKALEATTDTPKQESEAPF